MEWIEDSDLQCGIIEFLDKLRLLRNQILTGFFMLALFYPRNGLLSFGGGYKDKEEALSRSSIRFSAHFVANPKAGSPLDPATIANVVAIVRCYSK